MATLSSTRGQSWWRRLIESPSAVWHRLTEAPEAITDVRTRRQIRLNSVLCLSSLMGGLLGFTAVHYGSLHNLYLHTSPVFEIFVVCMSLIVVAYFLGRNEHTLGAAPVVVILSILAGNVLAVLTNPAEFFPYIIYVVVVDVFASLLLTPLGTRITLVISLGVLLLYPLYVPEISFDMALRALGPLFVVSIMIAVGVTNRERDIRTIERQARQLDEARQQAESANQLKGVFLGMVSHELRNPLNNILGYSDQMMMGLTGSLPGDAIEAAERIHRNGENLGRMIDDLLVLSRLESGSLTIVRRPFRLDELVADINRSFRERTESRGLAFITSIDTALPEAIVGDPQRIEQIVGNLVSNAVKFTDQGSIDIHLRRSGPDEWSAEVRDTGIGMTKEAAGHVFDRFYQVDSTSRRSYSGAGLGLAIARELAILMGGSITLTTGIDAGSTFTVVLPLTTTEPDLYAMQADSAVSAT